MIRMPRMPSSTGALAYFAAWLVPWRPVFRVRSPRSGLSLFVHRKDVIGRHVAKYGEHEPELTRWIAARLAHAPPGLFVDVGANVGWHSLHAARQQNVEAVIAFEPDLFNAYLLDRNICENAIDNVVVSTCAVGARAGTARLYRYKTSNLGRHSMLEDYGRGFRTVPQLDLDAALRNLGFADRPVSILKIDVEGYEPDVIAGASGTLARTDAVILEFSPALSRAGGSRPATRWPGSMPRASCPTRSTPADWSGRGSRNSKNSKVSATSSGSSPKAPLRAFVATEVPR